MSRSDEQRIADIVDASKELAEIVGRGEAAFGADLILRRAAERLLEIIGEAASNLSEQTTRNVDDVAWQDVRRLRIVLAHHYHRVDHDQIWTIASVDVPALAQRLSGMDA